VEGIAAKLDRFLARTDAEYYNTVRDKKIVFHRPDADDPGDLLTICLTIMVAATLQVERGVENLWRHGESAGMMDYPNFGQFIPRDYFKAFLSAFPYLWAEEKYWDVPDRDLPW